MAARISGREVLDMRTGADIELIMPDEGTFNRMVNNYTILYVQILLTETALHQVSTFEHNREFSGSSAAK